MDELAQTVINIWLDRPDIVAGPTQRTTAEDALAGSLIVETAGDARFAHLLFLAFLELNRAYHPQDEWLTEDDFAQGEDAPVVAFSKDHGGYRPENVTAALKRPAQIALKELELTYGRTTDDNTGAVLPLREGEAPDPREADNPDSSRSGV